MCVIKPQPARKSSMASWDRVSATLWSPSDEGIVAHASTAFQSRLSWRCIVISATCVFHTNVYVCISQTRISHTFYLFMRHFLMHHNNYN